jgi:TRAP-type C4-dicarboxylate transport system permease small subunit
VPRVIASIPKIVVSLLLVAAIVNLLIGVFLRYVMIPVTDWLDMDPIPFTWVEEVGDPARLAHTRIGAAIGVRERNHFTCTCCASRHAARC